MNQKFQALTDINIKLIDQQKLMQLDLKALESNVLDEVYIATDDERIYKVATELQLNVIMTKIQI